MSRRYGYGAARNERELVAFLTAELGRKAPEPCPRHQEPIDPVIGGCAVCLLELDAERAYDALPLGHTARDRRPAFIAGFIAGATTQKERNRA